MLTMNKGIKQKYINWIEGQYPHKQSQLNKCNVAVANLVFKFPELTIQVGYANRRYHCWAKDEHGNIIDPTSKQFDAPIEYKLIAERFLEKDEIELSTGALFLNDSAPGKNALQ